MFTNKDNLLQKIEKAINKISYILKVFGLWSLLAIMFLSTANVVFRYFSKNPIIGKSELIQFFMVILIFTGLASNQISKSNVFVDFVLDRLSLAGKIIVQKFVMLPLSLVIVSLIAWQLYVKTAVAFSRGEVSAALYIPVYPFSFVAAIGSAVLAVVLLFELLYTILTLKSALSSNKDNH